MSIQGPAGASGQPPGCGDSGGQLSAPGFSLFPEPLAPVGAALVITGEAGPALPLGTRIQIPV